MRDADERAWLRSARLAEDAEKAALLAAALHEAAADPRGSSRGRSASNGGTEMSILAGDAIDVLARPRRAPAGGRRRRVVFHFATRMHVPPERRAAFDAAVDCARRRSGPLFHFWLEPPDVSGMDGLERGPRCQARRRRGDEGTGRLRPARVRTVTWVDRAGPSAA